MLTITVPEQENYDEEREKFVTLPAVVLELEHSLVAVSKWESEFEKPFLSDASRTAEELLGYVRAMTLTPEIPPEVFLRLSGENFEKINGYINKRMTATTINRMAGAPANRSIITAELVYWWMSQFKIPPEFDTWHLNRLFTLIEIASVKSQPPKKMGRQDAAAQQRAINEARKQATGSRG
jgi:hypothetical protein